VADDQPTQEQPPAEDRPADETAVMPPAQEPPRWSARAGVPVGGPRQAAPDQQWVPDQQPRTWWAPILIVIAILVLIGLIALGLWVATRSQTGTGPSPSASPSPSPSSPSPSPSPSPSRSTSPPATMVSVPSLQGVSVTDAEQILQSQGLNWKVTTRVSATHPAGTVIETSPPAGVQVPAGTEVILVVATPPPTSASPSPPSPSPSSSVNGRVQ
jgi:eukaryotic-like serine/threonine-protein kinase